MEDKLIKQIVDNWINNSRDTIPFPNLMNELLDYGSKISDNLSKAKANRIYIKCLRAKKLQLADKIANKYRLNEIKDDAVIAMRLYMMAIQKIQKDGK